MVTAGDLVDKLDWRLRLLGYGLSYLLTEEGQGKTHEVVNDLDMLTAEMGWIIKPVGGGSGEVPTIEKAGNA